MACQIRRDNKKQITEVKTDKDQDSLLYKELLSEVNALDQSGRKTLQNRLRPWVGRYIDNLSNGDLALGLYKQAFSPNFEGFYGKWRTDKTLPNLDVNGEPRLTSDVREYLFNGEGKPTQSLTPEDRPTGSRVPTQSQTKASTDINEMSKGDIQTTAEEKQINTVNELSGIDSLQREEAITVLSQDKTPIHNSIRELLDPNGHAKVNQPDRPDDVQFNYIKDRINSYPENSLFKVDHTIVNPKTGEAVKSDLMVIYDKDGQTTIDYFNFFQRDVTSTTENTPWFIEKALQNKLVATRDALIASGVDPNIINRMQALPIQVDNLGVVEMGEINPIYEVVDALLPITIRQQSTGDAQIDELLTSLYKQKDSGNYSGSLKKAINYLQSKYSAEPLIWQTGEAIKAGEGLNTQWENQIKNLDFATAEEADLSSYIKNVTDQLDTLNRYKKNLEQVRSRSSELGVTENQLDYYSGEVSKAIEPLKEITRQFADKFSNSRGHDNITDPEAIIDTFSQWKSGTNKLTTTSLNVLSEVMTQSYIKADKRGQSVQSEILRNVDAFRKKYGSAKGATDIIFDKKSHALVPKISPEYNKSLDTAIKNRDGEWIQENVDIDTYKAKLSQREQLARDSAEAIADPDAQEKALRRVENLYSTEDVDSEGWFHTDILRKVALEQKWYSEEYKKLLLPANKEALDTYNVLENYIQKAVDLGYLPSDIAGVNSNTFVPWANATFMEMVASGKGIDSAFGERLLRSITIAEGDTEYGYIDPITGQPVRKLPKFMIKEIDNASEDVFSSFIEWSKFVERYGEFSKVEGIIRNMSQVEKAKGSLNTDRFGRLSKEGGERSDNPNTTIFDNQMDALLYGHNTIKDGNLDKHLGKVPEILRKINTALGRKVFNEKLIGQPISLSKSLDSLTNWTRAKALNLNVLSSLSNMFGGHYQSLLNSGKYFTKTDLISAEYKAFEKNFSSTSEARWLKAAMDYFLVGEHQNTTHENLKKVKGNLSSEAIHDFFSVGLRSGDIMVRYMNGIALIDNMIVVDGKLHNAREYYKKSPEYQARYTDKSITEAERLTLERGFDQRIQQLKNEYGIRKHSHIDEKTQELVIDGVDRFSREVNLQTAIHNDLIDKAIGAAPEYVRRKINLVALGRSASLFKSWILPMAEQRFGGFKLNAATGEMEWGRMRQMVKYLYPELRTRLSTFVDVLKATDKGIKMLETHYEEAKKDYEEKTGKTLKMSKEDFYDMTRSNLRTAAYDLLGIATIVIGFLEVSSMLKDQKEEGYFNTNEHNFFMKALDKARDEVTYFYDPRNLVSLMGTSVFPATRTLNEVIRAVDHSVGRIWGMTWHNGEVQDNYNLIKDYSKLIPTVNQLTSLIPMFSDQLGKDLDIQISLPQNFTY